MSERIYYWDNFKGVLIFLVVFAHLLFLPSLHAFRDAIYMFHIPAFVFISGYFGKSTHSHCSESILKLLSAYIIFNSLFSIIYNAYSFLYTSSVYWYVFALIVWRLSAPCLAKYKSCLLILTALSILIGYYHEINGVFNLARIISFSPFYMAGYLLSCETAQERMIQKSPRVILTGVGSIVLAFLIGFFSYNVIGFSGEELCMYPYRSWEFGGIGRVCLMLTSAFSIYALGCIIPNKKSTTTIPIR